ncbi:PrsW family intramembrane metalloprotease [Actinocatenispora sera]|uniref:RsiW-degrading membrane proteinase PrsW (M82 family) n=1 Tax=Actinocatenispora sera TaxID=390989 RepID=A0A810LB14_9ACTN|nr:PrsW family intramembrane metalloprotease [Actinocatenispora sera]BCJ31461.1 hypothetical protein Asera_55690 [Actinocatenispora sera]
MTAPALRSPRELLWQPGNWTYWVYLAAVVVAFFSMLSAFQPLRVLAPAAAITAVGVNIALGVVIGLIIVWLSVIHRPPRTLAVAAVVWGGVVAVAIAFYVNDNLLGALPSILGNGTATNWGAAIAGPSNEEWLKAVGVLAVIGIGIRSVSRPIHGLFLGAWCGLGFQVVEDISYAMNGALTNPTSDAAGLAQILGVRGIIGLLPSHWVFAACSGYGIGYALLRRDRPLAVRVLFALAMFAIAWSMHFLWNSPLITGQLNPLIGMLIKVVLILAAFFVVYRLAMRAEWRWYRRVLDTDPALAGVAPAGTAQAGTDAQAALGTLVTAAEIRSLRTRRRRHRARRAVRRTVRREARGSASRRVAKSRGRQASRLTRRLQRAQGWLAITAATAPDQLPALRTRITSVRIDLARLGVAPGASGNDRRRRHRRADRQRDRQDVNRPRGQRGTDRQRAADAADTGIPAPGTPDTGIPAPGIAEAGTDEGGRTEQPPRPGSDRP